MDEVYFWDLIWIFTENENNQKMLKERKLRNNWINSHELLICLLEGFFSSPRWGLRGRESFLGAENELNPWLLAPLGCLSSRCLSDLPPEIKIILIPFYYGLRPLAQFPPKTSTLLLFAGRKDFSALYLEQVFLALILSRSYPRRESNCISCWLIFPPSSFHFFHVGVALRLAEDLN